LARKRTSTPSKPDDVRASRSIEALQGALLRLIEDKPFEQILLREITDEAGLSYPTFFRRFASKEDLLDHVAAEEVRHLLELGNQTIGGQDPRSAKLMCEYVEAHRQLWTTLLTGGATAAMREAFMREARVIAATNQRQNPWLPTDLAVPFVTNGLFEVLAWWLRQPEDYPVANIETLLDVLVIETTARRRNIALIEYAPSADAEVAAITK
jgi:AcrR family transcriptional regulator